MWNAIVHAVSDAAAKDFARLRLVVSGGVSLPGRLEAGDAACFIRPAGNSRHNVR
jgi:hypothetical protein